MRQGRVFLTLGTDAGSYAAGSSVKAKVTLSAAFPITVDQMIFAVQLKGTGANHDFYPVNNYSIGTTPQLLTSERDFSKLGNYTSSVAYYRDGSWHDLTPEKEFVVG